MSVTFNSPSPYKLVVSLWGEGKGRPLAPGSRSHEECHEAMGAKITPCSNSCSAPRAQLLPAAQSIKQPGRRVCLRILSSLPTSWAHTGGGPSDGHSTHSVLSFLKPGKQVVHHGVIHAWGLGGFTFTQLQMRITLWQATRPPHSKY